ncbi:MAG: nitrile hydratase subunit beta [Gammaproteobacteria bacterium]|jgi:nitrile hydratase|nr:nitrile hydratase subunit beta [Gammaproteobacteria bacterium]MBT3859342.1 nitrile hydratase subunit beta [Gammaproteobacteria bacterium]MBT3986867.1 nitrile hydratase subunit beta [Gammaproteobacteria bacterium]MBT4255802.1 nitrile hydratase subunit beta [Gammaproteobacteria bacterium]MBT4581944.1 nitrile hydratase subunit beta [Gammaproteobacteria bacterium]
MKGGHDLGGKSGHGPINPEAENDEPVFHADWERRVFALTVASGMLGKWNIDESRHARERQPAQQYLNNSYYENWLEGIETLLLDKSLLKKEELQKEGLPSSTEGNSAPDQNLRVPGVSDALKILASGGPSDVLTQTPARFAVGDLVKVRIMDGAGHTRAPEYVHSKQGTIELHIGCHAYPDLNSTRNENDEIPGEHLYSVSFKSEELWPEGSEDSKNSEVRIDLWEPYLEKLK